MPRRNCALLPCLLPFFSSRKRNPFCARVGCAALGLALALLLLGPAVRAGELSLEGTVEDPHGLAVAGATVRLFVQGGESPEPVRVTLADHRGRFRIGNLEPGRYRVEAFAAGFARASETVEVGETTSEVRLMLAVAGIHEGVLVTATRREDETSSLPLAAAVISSEQLDRGLATNVARALEELPGVNWANAGAFRSRPVIRGLDSNRILVLVDGERLNNGRTSTTEAGIETSLVDFAQIEQVEVVRGPGSVLYGSDAFGGVINIRTRAANPSPAPYFNSRLRSELSSNSGTRRAQAEISGGNRWLSARMAGSGGGVQDYASPAGRVFGSGVDEYGAFGDLRVYPAEEQSVFFKFLDRAAHNFGLPTLEAAPVFFAEFPVSKLRKFSWGYTGRYPRAAFSSLQARFYQQDQSRDFFNILRVPGFTLSSDTVTSVETFGLDVQATSAPRGHLLSYGVTFYRDRNHDQRVQVMNPETNPVILSQAPSVPNSTLSGTGWFAQDQFALGRVRLIGGVRLDHFRLRASDTPNFDPNAFGTIVEDRSDVAVSGNAGATVDVWRGWQVTANVARAFREPNLFERYFFGRGSVGGFVVPNSSLEPETSAQYDLGTRWHGGPLRVSFNYFLNELHDLIVSAPGSFQGQTTIGGQPVFQNQNVARARIQGVETTAEVQFEAWRSRWTPSVSLAWQRGTDRASGEPLPLIAPFVSQMSVRWQPLRWRAWSEWRARIVTGSERVPVGRAPIAAYTVFGWRWGYELVRGEAGLGAHLPRGVSSVDLHFGVENLGNRLYRGLFETAPEAGREFRFGVAFNFSSAAR